MADSNKIRSNTNYSMNLFIIGIAIVIILLIKRSKLFDKFVGNVQVTPIGNGGNNFLVPGSYPMNQPMMYAQQLYPAKMPWYPETGRPCSGKCGITGVCTNGICQMRDQTETVFNVKI
jgi:hypothetical protein